ncbi:elongation of very long chain fatty acids protein AAEL008004-like isoform X2 [Daktulosphaira vitifoliae]|uniref:elongation of very long chain fatty acids protein AAEL008004-like isoform X1 n=1 Tax=Daktulosphaira vitifoliae TaxID=58002 RepID=UPI0021A9A2A1|nr:elongation of very long chain fatty acids protein AAEL008004-like isoform X1 [Daktulosphaira vitifoliae]XP_050520240.1 elongation of very long chain fatty acids protein AAEL008004-like isoform X2 [Daktulosphaira vitifoliae]XP_050520241.1 elongation of very long chain fatty acids protein AAEL008004-like isoform X2 [Daktulosphaira vitifoliae]
MTSYMMNVDEGLKLNFTGDIRRTLNDLLQNELVWDDEVDSWMFMSSSIPVFSIIIIYLLFVLKVGPEMMKNRNPINLKYPMLLYNIIQIAFNGYIVSLLFTTPGAITHHFNNLCHPIPRNLNNFLLLELNKGSWYFFISKLMDLTDTVFFVLRKKQSQVSFLHIYHHCNMVITCWAYLKFIKGEQLLLCGILNATVHVIMYSYYFLSALGPQIQTFLWWKKYLTRIQITQFLLLIAYQTCLYVFDCNFPKLFVMYIIADVAIFLYLFVMFYRKTYNENKRKERID